MQPTQALLKRYRKLPLTTKDIKKGFYKGTRTGSMGQHTKFGGYVIDWNKVRTYVVPAGLDAFKVCVPVVQNVGNLPMFWREREKGANIGMIRS